MTIMNHDADDDANYDDDNIRRSWATVANSIDFRPFLAESSAHVVGRQSNLHDYHWDLRQGDHHDCHGYGDTCAIVFSPYQKIHLVWSLTQRRYRDSSNVYVLIIILVHAFLFGGLPDDLPMFWMYFPGISHSPSFFLRLLQSSSRSSDTDTLQIFSQNSFIDTK